jgi:EAL domain-containing protein (putative c-di-GMP-specific phosphodiesterase class I)
MYEAKSAGRGKYRFFQTEMDQRFQRRTELEGKIRMALASGEIVPYFQPIFDLARSRIVGFEALARWIHPTCGIVEPMEFIPIVEDLGLSDSLTERILRTACLASRDWPAHLTLSVNVSPAQLEDGRLPSRIAAILTEAGFSPDRLIVEVTESAIITDTHKAAEVFAALQNLGIRTALDDFGKGYSSLSHLRQLHFDHLKIDSSFVRSMPSAESREIVSAVAGLGKALGMHVIAEGVETCEIAEALRELGCEQAQGYLFGRPAPAVQAMAIAAIV